MSGYRSLKRVLGETNLERKVRWIFGICVTLLILLTFSSVGLIAKRLVDETTNHKGRNLARNLLFKLHWVWWTQDTEGEQRRQVVEQLSTMLTQEEHASRILRLDDSQPTDPVERQIVANLKKRAEEQYRTAAARKKSSQPGVADKGELNKSAAVAGKKDASVALREEIFDDPQFEPVFDPVPAPDQDLYYYYQVVDWSNVCLGCHESLHGGYGDAASTTYEGSVFDNPATPFRVIRVTMPYDDTRTAMNRTWAVLIAVGIATVSLSMLIFWAVVRYVIVKPLSHLREVSESVAQGDLDQRAEIHTGDEFEELAQSFNKMLRNLLETQGELREVNDNLDAKVDELARLNMQLHEMNRMKGEYLATMSHELRTPLNSILGFSEVLGNIDSLTDKQRRYVQNIQKGGRSLLEMINDILDLEKMEAGKMEVRPSEFKIGNVIQAQCELVRTLAEDKKIDLTVDIEGELPLLYQDQAKVQQILMNLLSNAIKFTPDGGRIRVGARADSRGRIEFWVADNGVGIPESEKDVIFEKFRQGNAALGRDNLTREFSGTGLGLSIVKELSKLLGGEVSVESELGKGSTFRVVIPWMRADQPLASTKLSAKLDEIARPRLKEEPEAAVRT
jgi:two-component system sensor histidine kinase BarA